VWPQADVDAVGLGSEALVFFAHDGLDVCESSFLIAAHWRDLGTWYRMRVTGIKTQARCTRLLTVFSEVIQITIYLP